MPRCAAWISGRLLSAHKPSVHANWGALESHLPRVSSCLIVHQGMRTRASRLRTRRLNSADFPTFGRPTMATCTFAAVRIIAQPTERSLMLLDKMAAFSSGCSFSATHARVQWQGAWVLKQ